MRYGARKLAIGIEVLLGTVNKLHDRSGLCSGRLWELGPGHVLAQFAEIHETRVGLRLGEEYLQANDFGSGLREPRDHLRQYIARPRPPTDLLDTLIVYRNDGDRVGAPQITLG